MKTFLMGNFVFVILILTSSYVTDFILKCFDLTAPTTPNAVIMSGVIRVGYLVALTVIWGWFRFSWKKKYEASLNPQERAAADHGREAGGRVAIVVSLVLVVYLLMKYVWKM